MFPINRNWRFHPGMVDGAHLSGFNNFAFEQVAIPHEHLKLPWHSFDDKEYQFISTYRRRFQYSLLREASEYSSTSKAR